VNAPNSNPSRRSRAVKGILVSLAAALLMNDLRIAEALSYRSERTLLVPLVVIAGVLLSAVRLQVVLTSLLGLLAALWLAVAFTPLDRALADGLPRVDALGPADAIYVLASDVQPDGDLTVEALARLVHGIELAGQALAPRLVVGELPRPHGRYADSARRFLDELHLPTELLTVGPVGTTHDEAVLLGELFKKNGWRRVLLVTSPLHSRRAAAVFEAQGLTVVSAPTREAKYDLETLSSPDERLRAFPEIVHEELGIWVYRRRGWLDRRED